MDRAFLVLSALLLNAILAGPRSWYIALGIPRFTRIPAQALRELERRLNRDQRSLKDREARGWVLIAVLVSASLVVGALGSLFFQRNFNFIELVILTCLLPVRPTWDMVSHIRRHLHAGNVVLARESLAYTPWRHHARLDEYAVARAGIETLAVHFSEKICAPLFWYLLLGLPGLFASKTIYLLHETLVRPDTGGQAFSKAAHTVHSIVHYVPSRFAALLWLTACVFLPAATLRLATAQITPAMKSASPQILALTTVAAILRVTLGGPGSIYANGKWIGSGTVKPLAADVKRGLMLFALLHLMLMVLCGIAL